MSLYCAPGWRTGRGSDVPVGKMMGKRGSLFTASLRDRPVGDKARIVAGALKDFWPHAGAGRILPATGWRFPLADAAGAHSSMESGQHIGKIVLTVGNDAAGSQCER